MEHFLANSQTLSMWLVRHKWPIKRRRQLTDPHLQMLQSQLQRSVWLQQSEHVHHSIHSINRVCACTCHAYMTIHSGNYFSSLRLVILLYTFFLSLILPSGLLSTVGLIYIHSLTKSPRSPSFIQCVALTETSGALCLGPCLPRFWLFFLLP